MLEESDEEPEEELLEESEGLSLEESELASEEESDELSPDDSLLVSPELVLSELALSELEPVLLSLDEVPLDVVLLLSEPEGLDEVSSVSGVELEPVEDALELVVPVLELSDEALVLEPSDEASTVISLLFSFSEELLSAGSEAEVLVSTSEPEAVLLLSPTVKAM